MTDEKKIKIKIALEIVLDEIKRLSEFESDDILSVVNDNLDSTTPPPELTTIIKNQYILDIIHLEKRKPL